MEPSKKQTFWKSMIWQLPVNLVFFAAALVMTSLILKSDPDRSVVISLGVFVGVILYDAFNYGLRWVVSEIFSASVSRFYNEYVSDFVNATVAIGIATAVLYRALMGTTLLPAAILICVLGWILVMMLGFIRIGFAYWWGKYKASRKASND